MQELYEMPTVPVRRSPSRESMQRAGARLSDNVTTLLLSLLFCLTVLYALYLFTFFAAGLSLALFSSVVVAFALYCALLALMAVAFLPLWAGRIRMAGLVAAGLSCTPSALFYYFCTPRRFLRGICVAILFVIGVICPLFFGAAALYAGKETLSLGGALRAAREGTRGRMRDVLGFYTRVAWHVLLSVLTLGVLWLLYYSHHSAVAYFDLTMTMDPKGDLQ